MPFTADLEDGDEKSGKRVKQASQVYRFAITWSIDGRTTVPAFKAFQPKISTIFRQVSGKKGHFIYQLEKTLRTVERKEQIENYSDNYHYQCFLHTTNKHRPVELRDLLNEMGMTNCYVSPASSNGVLALQNYCMKQDETYVAGPWADRPITSIKEYDGSDLPMSLYPWQGDVYERIENEPDPRILDWIFDPEGNLGKSAFTKYMQFHRKAVSYSFMDAKGLAYMVVKGGAHRAYMFDLPRTKGKNVSMKDIYQTLESIKNGDVKTDKYEGGHLLMPAPHVWVTSNYMPDFTAASRDRFRVWMVDPNNGEMFTYIEPEPSVQRRSLWQTRVPTAPPAPFPRVPAAHEVLQQAGPGV